MYNYGDVAYIGGGFGVGIHNTLEAAVWNMPVIFGPNNKKFQEAQGLLKSGGGFEINTYEDFEGLMSKLMNDEVFLKQAVKPQKTEIQKDIESLIKLQKRNRQ